MSYGIHISYHSNSKCGRLHSWSRPRMKDQPIAFQSFKRPSCCFTLKNHEPSRIFVPIPSTVHINSGSPSQFNNSSFSGLGIDSFTTVWQFQVSTMLFVGLCKTFIKYFKIWQIYVVTKHKKCHPKDRAFCSTKTTRVLVGSPGKSPGSSCSSGVPQTAHSKDHTLIHRTCCGALPRNIKHLISYPWTHQKGLSQTRPDKIVLIMEVKVQHNQNQAISSQAEPATSRECEHMWAQHHSHFQNTHTHKGSGNILRFSQFISAVHISICQSMSSPWPRTLQLRIMTQVQTPHSQGSEKFEAYPIHLCQPLIFWSLWSRRRDIIMTSSWHHHILGLCTISLWVVCILGLIKRASAERDLTRLSSSWRWKFNTIKTKQSLHKPNQQPAENVSICELSIIRTFKTLTPTKGQQTFWGFLNSSRPSTYQSAKACHHRDQELCSSESWHRFRRLIPTGRRSLRLTQFILASISFFDHFGAEDVTSSWHHHDIITFWDFAPSAYEWCAFLDSSKGPQPNETWQDCPHHGGESSTQSKPSNLFTSRTSNQQRMWAYVSSASFALSKHSHPQRVRKHSEVFSIHLGRPHINLPKHVITVTKNVAAQNHDTGSDASFPGVGEVWGLPNSSLPASHFLITLEQKTWHHHDIIMTSSHFGTLHHQPMSGVHSWTHQKGLSRTRPDKIVLIMEVKVQHNQNQAISSQAEPATSRECEHMWAQHHSHFQNTHTHKGSGNILRFSQFISAVHISICQSMSSPWPRTLQLRIMTQVQTPHSQGSEKFEAYPIHLCQHLIFWSLWSRRRDIIMTSSWHHHILGLCTISLWVVCILGLIKRASAERDLTRLSSSWRWKFNTIKTKQSLHKPNQQPAENVSICELSIIRTFKTLTPTKGQQTFWGFLNSSRPSTYQSAKACHHRDQELCSSESWHRFRRLIPTGRRSLRLTQFILASISFFDHFGAEDVTSSWHHHDIITFWDFAPSAYEWCAFLDSSKGPQPNETWQDCPHHGGESSTQSKPSNLFTSRTSNQQRMWAYVSSASFALSKHSHPQRVSKHSEVFSIHLGRPHINLPKHVITVTKNFAAQNHDTGSDASFPRVGEVWGLPNSSWPASHFLITLEQKTWHHHDIIMTSSHFGTLHHQPMSGVHSWTHQKGLSRTRPDKIVLIMEVKVQHNQNQAISSQAEPATSRECEHMWAQHHSHFQKTHTHKGSANILRFSQFISAVHISICQSMSSPCPRTLQLRIMTQVQTPHSQGSEKFEAYPIHLCQHLIFWSLWSRRRDIIMTSSWHHHDIITFWDFAPSAYEWCAFLDSSKGPQPNETWQDCPHHGGEVQHNQNQAISSQAEPATSRECEHMWAQHHSHFLKHSHPHTLTLSLPQCRWDHMCLQIAPTYIFQVGLSWHWYQTNLQAIWVVWVRLQPSFGATFVLTCKTAWRPNGAPPESISSQVGPLGHPEIWRRVGAGKSASFWGHLCFPRPMSLVLGDKKFSLTSRN